LVQIVVENFRNKALYRLVIKSLEHGFETLTRKTGVSSWNI
jgi:hypothetical protein